MEYKGLSVVCCLTAEGKFVLFLWQRASYWETRTQLPPLFFFIDYRQTGTGVCCVIVSCSINQEEAFLKNGGEKIRTGTVLQHWCEAVIYSSRSHGAMQVFWSSQSTLTVTCRSANIQFRLSFWIGNSINALWEQHFEVWNRFMFESKSRWDV